MELKLPFDADDELAGARPNPVRVASIGRLVAERTTSVKPLPSNNSLLVCGILLLVSLAGLLTFPVGYLGIVRMPAVALLIQASSGLLCLGLLIRGVIEEMIPGTRVVVVRSLVVPIIFAVLGVAAIAAFRQFSEQSFLESGIRCLGLGLVCAVPAGGGVILAFDRSYPVDPIRAGVAGGALSGMVGVLVLVLHCPIFNSAHVLAWHATIVPISAIVGVLCTNLSIRMRHH